MPETDFSCRMCVRPSQSDTPSVDEDGVSLSPFEILAIYNERRYQHYLDGFNDVEDLARHLHNRTMHFAETATGDDASSIKASGFAANLSTIDWWKRARARTSDDVETVGQSDYEANDAVIRDWMRLAPAARFAKLRKQLMELGERMTDREKVLDNARQLPEDKELSPQQIADLKEAQERSRKQAERVMTPEEFEEAQQLIQERQNR